MELVRAKGRKAQRMRCPPLADSSSSGQCSPSGSAAGAGKLDALQTCAFRQTNRDRIASQLLCFRKFLVLITDVAYGPRRAARR